MSSEVGSAPARVALEHPPTVSVVTHEARYRMQRMLFFATGIGALVFGVLLSSGESGIVAQMPQLVPAYAWGSVAIVIVLPATFVALPFIVSRRVMNVLAAIASIGFVVVELLWVPSMSVEVLASGTSPWLQGVTALAATVTAVRWQGPWVWLYALATGPIVAVNLMLARQEFSVDALLAGLGGMLFSLILMGVAIAVVEAADRQDEVAAEARTQASLEAARQTRDREQIRINAIVHDDVMSVLLTAGRRSPAPDLPDRARRAIEAITAITPDDAERASYGPSEFATVLRSTINDIMGDTADIEFSASVQDSQDIPPAVVAATTEAFAEAMRNSKNHAGPAGEAVAREVRVEVSAAGIDVQVKDAGRGFSARAVGPRRLGIRVSIMDRMNSVPGGSAAVNSSPGKGTTVTLSWSRP